jgi:autotransporter-associated beta strand protein
MIKNLLIKILNNNKLRLRHTFAPKSCFMIAFLFLATIQSFAATRTASVSGNWSSTTTWGGSAVPTAADAVIINPGITVTIDLASPVAGSITGSGTISCSSSGANLTVGADNTSVTYSGIIQNGTQVLSITKNGTGTWTLSGTNTYTGTTTINAGTLKIGSTTALGVSSATTITSGAALDLNGITLSTARPITINGTGISSGGAITNSSATAASYSGAITLGSASSVVANSGAVTLSGTIATAGFALTLDGSTGGTASGVISGSGSVTKNGSGTWILSGANTYTGTTSINAGTLKLGNAAALGTTASGTSITSGAVLDLNGINYSNAEALTVNGTGISGSGAIINSSSTGATYAGLLTLGSSSSIVGGTGTINISNTGTITGATFSLTLGGTSGGTVASIIGTTSGTLTKADAGTWTLSGANTYTGITSINAGTLKLGNAAALGVSSATTITSGAALDLNGITLSTARPITINGTGVSSGGAITNSSATAASYSGAITLGSASSVVANSGAVTLSGAIATAGFTLTLDGSTGGTASGVISGSGSVTKNGSGTWTLSGANTYTGTTTINAGTLKAGSTQAFGNGSAVTLANVSGAVLDITGYNNTIGSLAGGGTTGGNVTLGTATLTIGTNNTNTTYAGVISGTGAVIKSGTGTWTLSGSNTYTGLTTISAGTLKLGATGGGTNTPLGTIGGATIVSSGAVLDLNGYTLGTAEPLTLNGTGLAASPAGALTNTGGNASYSGAITLGSSGATITTTTSGTLTLSGAISGATYPLIIDGTGTGSISGVIGTTSGIVTKNGSGIWTLSGANTYTGGTTLNAGTLNINNSQALGTAAGTFTINGGTIDNTSGAAITTVNYPQSWKGDFTFTGTNNLNLGTGAVAINADRQVTVTANTLTIGGVISASSYSLTKAGAGILLLGSNAVSLNNLTINAGTFTSTSSTLNLAGTFTNNGTFTSNSGTVVFNGTSAQTIGGTSTSSFNNLTVNNSSGVSLGIAETINGTLTLTSGVLQLGNYNLTLANTTAIAGTFSASTMIGTDGTGYLIRSATATNDLFNGTYPVGSGGIYSPFTISGLTTFAALTRQISVRAVPTNPTILTNSINRYWDIPSATNITTSAATVLSFQYDASEIIGNSLIIQPYTNGSGSWKVATGASTGTNPATATGNSTITGLWTIGAPSAFYSYRTGNWNDPTTWTSDPSGSTQVGTTIPNNKDVIVILTNRTVSLTSTISSTDLDITINDGGFLNLSSYQFPAGLAALRGQGTLQIASAGYFPSTSVTNTLVLANGGTTEYDATTTIPSTPSTYNNLTISIPGSGIATETSNLTLYGNLYVKQGTFQINDATAQRLQLTINGNVTVDATGSIKVGTGVTNTATNPTTITAGGTAPFINYYSAQSHTIIVNGDFTNNGTVRFTNLSAPQYATFPPTTIGTTTGFATVYFQGSTDNTLTCNGQTDFYNLVLDKGVDQTFKLYVYSSAYNNFRLFGANNAVWEASGANPNIRKALWIRTGTLDLKGLVVIPSLTEGSATGADYFIPSNGALILDGSDVIVLSTADDYREVNTAYTVTGTTGITQSQYNSLGILGDVILNNGYLSTRESAGITYWSYSQGQLTVNGGTLDSKQIDDASGSTAGLFSYFQTAGTVNLRGRFQHSLQYSSVSDLTNTSLNTTRATNGTDATAATFNLTSNTANGFTMTGGTLKIYDVCGNTAATDYPAFLVNCSTSNINVTGGTVEIDPTTGTAPDAPNFLINTTAPIGNLILNRASSTSAVKLSTSVKILQNLNLTAGVLDANTKDISIGGNYTIASGTTYTCTGTSANRTIFNGTGNQTFTVNLSGSLNLNKLKIDKASTDALIFAGSQKTINVADSMFLYTGKLGDNGNTINASGYVYNSGTHYGTGKIALTGTAAQTIDGNGSGTFGNMDLNNSNATISAPVSLAANVTITGTLTLVNSKIFNIASNNINLPTTGTITSTPGFSNTCFIQTSGQAGDGGITKAYSSTTTSFTFPLGAYSTKRASTYAYTPATIGFSSAPTTYGTVTVNPVGYEHPATTTKGQSLTYFWRVKSSGFTGIVSNSVTHSFNYSVTDVAGTETNYVPALYNRTTYTWYTGATSNINTTTHTISDWTTSSNYVDADYTAGIASSFGTPKKFYSRQSGTWGTSTTWSFTSNTGAADTGGTVPGTNDIVIIAGNDSVTLNTNNTVSNTDVRSCASLQIEKGSALDIGYNPGCSFGIVSTHPNGNGNFRLTTSYNSNSTFLFPSGDFSDFNANIGTTELYSTNPVAGTTYWLPNGIYSYGNLILSPLGGSNIIFPNNNITVYGNLITRGQNADSWFCPTWSGNYPLAPTTTIAKTITVKGNLLIQGGALIWYGNGTVTQNFVVNGDVIVNPNSALYVYSGATSQNMSIGGNLINNTIGIIPSGVTTTCKCDFSLIPLTFFGNNSSLITNTTNPPLTIFGNVTVNKGSSQATTLTCNISGTLTTPTDNWLTLQNGTFIYNRTGNFTISTVTPFSIPATAGLTINTPSTVYIANSTTSANTLYLSGNLTLTSSNTGSVLIGKNASTTTHSDIEYSSGGAATIEVDGGNLIVNGQIRRNPSNSAGILNYTQTGGNVSILGNAVTASPTNVNNAKLEILNNGSSFNMTGGQLYIVNGGGASTYGDLYLRPQTGSVTGGTITFTQTPAIGTTYDAVQSYLLDATIPLNNLTITGKTAATARNATVKLMVSPLTINGNLTISNAYSFLDANSSTNIDVTIDGDFTNNGTYTCQKNTTTFSGNTQNILGTPVASYNTFYDLVVSPVTSLTLNNKITVQDNLTISTGRLICSSYLVSVAGNVTNNGTYTDNNAANNGVLLNGTVLQHIAGTGAFGRLELNNAAGAQTDNNINLTENLMMDQGILNINKYLLTLGLNSNILSTGAAYSSTKMIATDGVGSSSGLKKYFNTISSATTFTYPIGTTGKYTPVILTINSNNTVGSLRINPVNSTQPSVIDPANALKYYWTVESSGISALQGNLVFNYLQPDVVGSQENSYLAARLITPGTTWSLTSNCDASLNTITFNYPGDNNLSGDYTAGIASAFPSNIPTFTSNQNGNWNDPTIWTQTDGTSYTLTSGPNGFIVIVNHDVTVNANYCSAYKTTINGKLKVVSPYFGHNFGNVDGNGTLYLESGSFPAGNYSTFLSCENNGTVEYGGTSSYTIVADLYDKIPNMLISGSGTKTLPNKDLTICNSLKIGTTTDAPVLDNSVYNKKLTLLGTMERYNSSIFKAGSGSGATVSFAGSSVQTLGGTLGNFSGTSALNNLEINNENGLTLNTGGAIEVSNNLLLTNGLINTSSTGTLTITNTATDCVTPSGGSSSSFVNGPLTKRINQSDYFNFPVGQDSYLGNNLTLSSTQTGTQLWTVQYHNPNSTFNNYSSPLAAVNWDDYWTVSSSSGNLAIVTIAWNSNSTITPLVTTNGISDMRVAGYNTTNGNWEEIASNATGNNYNGSVSTSSRVTIPSSGSANYTTASVSTLIPKAKLNPSGPICGTAGIPVKFSAQSTIPLNYILNYTLNGVSQTPITVTSVPYILPTPTSGTYKLTGFKYNNGNSTGVIDNTSLTTYDVPTTASAGSIQALCGTTTTTLNANTPTIGTGLWSIVSGNGGTVISPSNPTSQFNGLLNTSYVLKWTISNGTCTSSTTTTVSFTTLPDPPTASANQTVCNNSTIANLTAKAPTGSVVNWYSSSTGGSALSGSFLLISGNTYYAESYSGCSSLTRTAVKVKVMPPLITGPVYRISN